MRKKDDLAIDKIMECAKTEFLEKGFEGRVYAQGCRKCGLYYRHALR